MPREAVVNIGLGTTGLLDDGLEDEVDELAGRLFVALIGGASSYGPHDRLHIHAFHLAEAFIMERERRRGRLPSQR